jgi:hypothetical protein
MLYKLGVSVCWTTVGVGNVQTWSEFKNNKALSINYSSERESQCLPSLKTNYLSHSSWIDMVWKTEISCTIKIVESTIQETLECTEVAWPVSSTRRRCTSRNGYPVEGGKLFGQGSYVRDLFWIKIGQSMRSPSIMSTGSKDKWAY